MKQEDKELLLKDLCARLSCGVKICYKEHVYGIESTWIVDYIVPDIFQIVTKFPYGRFSIKDIKPYLRPMSSMTEDEKEEYCNLQDKFLCSSQYPVTDAYELFDWLNERHFDFRGLIPMGLAIEVTKENNPYASN